MSAMNPGGSHHRSTLRPPRGRAERLVSGFEGRRQDLVTALLAGMPAGPGLDAALGYRLGGTHLGVLVAGPDRYRAERLLTEARAATGARDRLLVPLAVPAWPGWLGFRGGVDCDVLARLREVVARAGVPVTLGGPARGVEGFREVYEEAWSPGDPCGARRAAA